MASKRKKSTNKVSDASKAKLPDLESKDVLQQIMDLPDSLFTKSNRLASKGVGKKKQAEFDSYKTALQEWVDFNNTNIGDKVPASELNLLDFAIRIARAEDPITKLMHVQRSKEDPNPVRNFANKLDRKQNKQKRKRVPKNWTRIEAAIKKHHTTEKRLMNGLQDCLQQHPYWKKSSEDVQRKIAEILQALYNDKFRCKLEIVEGINEAELRQLGKGDDEIQRLCSLSPPLKVLKTLFNVTSTSIVQAGFYKPVGSGDDATHLASPKWVKDKLDEESSDDSGSEDEIEDSANDDEDKEHDKKDGLNTYDDDDEDEPRAKRVKTEEQDVKIKVEPKDDVPPASNDGLRQIDEYAMASPKTDALENYNRLHQFGEMAMGSSDSKAWESDEDFRQSKGSSESPKAEASWSYRGVRQLDEKMGWAPDTKLRRFETNLLQPFGYNAQPSDDAFRQSNGAMSELSNTNARQTGDELRQIDEATPGLSVTNTQQSVGPLRQFGQDVSRPRNARAQQINATLHQSDGDTSVASVQQGIESLRQFEEDMSGTPGTQAQQNGETLRQSNGASTVPSDAQYHTGVEALRQFEDGDSGDRNGSQQVIDYDGPGPEGGLRQSEKVKNQPTTGPEREKDEEIRQSEKVQSQLGTTSERERAEELRQSGKAQNQPSTVLEREKDEELRQSEKAQNQPSTVAEREKDEELRRFEKVQNQPSNATDRGKDEELRQSGESTEGRGTYAAGAPNAVKENFELEEDDIDAELENMHPKEQQVRQSADVTEVSPSSSPDGLRHTAETEDSPSIRSVRDAGEAGEFPLSELRQTANVTNAPTKQINDELGEDATHTHEELPRSEAPKTSKA